MGRKEPGNTPKKCRSNRNAFETAPNTLLEGHASDHTGYLRQMIRNTHVNERIVEATGPEIGHGS